MTERWATAYHEAGHAVIATVLGLTVITASVDEGETRTPKEKPGHTAGFAKRSIITAFAGGQAEDLQTWSDGAGEARSEWDRYQANQICDHYADVLDCGAAGAAKREEFLHRFKMRARRLAKNHYGSIELIARQLMKERLLTGIQIRALVL